MFLTTSSARGDITVMLLRVREAVAVLALLGMSCTQDVDDPANFDSGPPNMDTGASAGDTAADTQGASEGDDGMVSNGGDSSSGGLPPADGSSGGEPLTGGPAEDSGGGNETCGDGMVMPGEQCDGVNLQGFDCSSLGLGTGTLACDAVTCTFDTSMCMGGGGGTGGPE
jgi:hypothetical protein